MNKAELIAVIAQKTDLTKKGYRKMFDDFVETVAETLKNGDKVSLVGFGTVLKQKRERLVRGSIPEQKRKIQIPATKTPHIQSW
jgi:DNA-binding protein HU-beta